MPKELSREILKLEARLEGFLKNEEAFIKGLRNCLEKFKELDNAIERLETTPDIKKVKELTELRLEATEMLNEALKRQSKAEHEKSHLLESYGALVLALEENFQRFYLSVWFHKRIR